MWRVPNADDPAVRKAPRESHDPVACGINDLVDLACEIDTAVAGQIGPGGRREPSNDFRRLEWPAVLRIVGGGRTAGDWYQFAVRRFGGDCRDCCNERGHGENAKAVRKCHVLMVAVGLVLVQQPRLEPVEAVLVVEKPLWTKLPRRFDAIPWNFAFYDTPR